MHPLLENISLPGIIAPGDTYIITAEKEQGWDPGPVDYMYVLTNDQEILPALDMELCIILADSYKLRRFVKWAEILDGVYEFRFICLDKETGVEVAYSLFLHRLRSFPEMLAFVKDLLIDSN